MSDFNNMAKQINEQMAVHLKTFRDERGLARTALARKLGASGTFVNKCENEGRRVDLGEFLCYCAGLSISPIVLVKNFKTRGLVLADVALSESNLEHEEQGFVNQKNQDFKVTTRIIGQVAGGVLKYVREEQRLSMRVLGQKIDMPHSFIGKIEWCARRLAIGEFIHLCERLNEEPADVLCNIIELLNKNR